MIFAIVIRTSHIIWASTSAATFFRTALNSSLQDSRSDLEILTTDILIRKLNQLNPADSNASKRSHICIICSSSFSKKTNLNRHISQYHNSKKLFYCDECNLRYSRKKHLSRHLATHVRNLHVIFESITETRESYVSPVKSYLQYLTNSRLQNLFHKFSTVYDEIFPRTPCSHCEELLIDTDIKWTAYDSEISYCLWTWFSISLHTHSDIVNERKMTFCDRCDKTLQISSMTDFWSKKLLNLKQRSRSFLSPLALKTNLNRTSKTEDRSNPEYSYRNLIDSKCS